MLWNFARRNASFDRLGRRDMAFTAMVCLLLSGIHFIFQTLRSFLVQIVLTLLAIGLKILFALNFHFNYFKSNVSVQSRSDYSGMMKFIWLALVMHK